MDTATAVSTGSSILADRSDAMVILVLVIVAVILWIWKIVIPQKQSDQKMRDADKEIHLQNANTLAELSKVTTKINDTTTHSGNTIRAIAEVKSIELDCIEMIATQVSCDVKSMTSEARGVLRAVRVGATTD
jgi:hypothetical protein